MKWRILLDGAQNAAMNMAVDEALFLFTVKGAIPPTVRLYTWSSPSLSIGYAQRLNEVCDVDACRRLGIERVRRISGGRAMLHHQELTYCVAASAEGLFHGLSVREVYYWVTNALRDAFFALGITVDPPSVAKTSTPLTATRGGPELPCLAVPTGHEITANGRKLVGSAQKWSRRGFLQHGSILLNIDHFLWRKATGLSPDAELGAIGLSELTANGVDTKALCQALRGQFEHLFGAFPTGDELSQDEKRVTELLCREKYSSPAWNIDRRTIDVLEPGVKAERD